MRGLQRFSAVIATLASSTLPAAAGAQTDTRHPNLNGIWQALGTANWNLEKDSASALDEFSPLGALAATAAGRSVVEGGTVPYRPEALAQRDENRARVVQMSEHQEAPLDTWGGWWNGRWEGNTLPAGTQIIVEDFRAKDGSQRANGREITFPDGTKLFVGSARVGAPDGG